MEAVHAQGEHELPAPVQTPLFRDISRAAARWPIRATEEPTEFAPYGLQPAFAFGARFDRMTAITAMVFPFCPDRQPLTAGMTQLLRVVAIGPVGAAVKGASVARVLSAHQKPGNALRA